MKVSADALPTVVWKCPGIHDVLCTTAFMPNEALIAPPHPPKAKSSIEKMTLDTSGSLHGSFLIHPNNPWPPLALPATSREAMIVNAVTKLGYRIQSVLNVCSIFHSVAIPGSMN